MLGVRWRQHRWSSLGKRLLPLASAVEFDRPNDKSQSGDCKRYRQFGFRLPHRSQLLHTYPAGGDFALWSRDIIEHEILPLLEEYWMDELETVALHKKKLFANGA